jgi:hypothetical protein
MYDVSSDGRRVVMVIGEAAASRLVVAELGDPSVVAAESAPISVAPPGRAELQARLDHGQASNDGPTDDETALWNEIDPIDTMIRNKERWSQAFVPDRRKGRR